MNSRYQVTVDYSQTVEQAAEAGNYDSADLDINSENFPESEAKRGIKSTRQKSQVTTQIVLIQRPRSSGCLHISTEEAKDALGDLGYRPANLYEILALGAQQPYLQRQFLVVGLGSSWVSPSDYRYVPCLDEYGSKRYLELEWTEDGWDGSWHFAAVLKGKI